MVALDLADSCGWAVLPSPGGAPLSGVQRLGRGGNAVERIRAAEEWLPELLRPVAWGRGSVAYEAPIFAAMASGARASAYYHLEALLISACTSLGVTGLYHYAPATVKKQAAGSGKASKEEVAAAMRTRWDRADLGPGDEADALAVLVCHLAKMAEAG